MPVSDAVLTADGSKNRIVGKLLEQAMGAAASKAMAEGVSDPDEIRRRMLQARADLKAQMDNGA